MQSSYEQVMIFRAGCKTLRQQKIDDFDTLCKNRRSRFGRKIFDAKASKRAILCGEEFCNWLFKTIFLILVLTRPAFSLPLTLSVTSNSDDPTNAGSLR